MFGATTTSSGLFGATPAGAPAFGAAPTAGGGLFGAKPAAAPAFGATSGNTNLFGTTNTAAKPNAFGATTSLFGSTAKPATPSTSLFTAPSTAATTPAAAAWPFDGAHKLFAYPLAPELRMVEEAAGTTDEASVKAGHVPEPLKEQLLQHQIKVDKQGRELQEGMRISEENFVQLGSHAGSFKQSVLELRSKLEQQRNAVTSLAAEARGCGQEAERALREARRLGHPEQRGKVPYTLEKPVPSDFFWQLLQRLQERLRVYQRRTDEIYDMVRPQPASGRITTAVPMDRLVAIMREQHQAFLSIAGAVAAVHERTEELREQYTALVREDSKRTAHLDIFERADKAERDRRKRAIRKVEESAAAAAAAATAGASVAAAASSVAPAAPTVGTATTGLFGSTPAATARTPSFFAAPAAATTTSTNLFGAPSTAAKPNAFGATSATSLFSSTAKRSTNSMFPTPTASTPAAGGLFSPAAAPAGGSLFGNTAPVAPNAPKPKRKSGKNRRAK